MTTIYCNEAVDALNRLLNAFAAKNSMKTRDPRFASFFTRTIDVLRESPSIKNVDALMEVFIKCRLAHVYYSKIGRERSEVRDEAPRSPYFNRRSASRGKLSRIDRGEINGSLSDLRPDSTQTTASRDFSHTQCTPQISAGNPLFSVDASASSCPRSDPASFRGTNRVTRTATIPHKRSLYARMGTAPSVPEQTLCVELCGALRGLEGTYFRKDSRGFLTISGSCALSQAQRAVVEAILAVSNSYTEVSRISTDYDDDLLAQAFLLESQSILEDYIHDIGDIPVTGRPLSLLRILSAIEVWRDRLIMLQRLYSLRNEPGTRIVERIYEIHSSLRQNLVVDKLMHCCAEVLCRSLSRWLSGLELSKYDSQIIEECPIDRYRIAWTPPFCTEWVAEYILKIGKSWRSVDFCKSTENLDRARAIVASQLNAESLYIQNEQHKLEHVVREVCRLICGSVVRSLVVEHHLVEHLDATRCLLLLHDAKFSAALFREFCACTNGLRSKLSQRDANVALLAASVASKTVQTFPFKVNFDTLPSLNDSPNTSSRLQFVRPLRPVYRPKPPVAELFSKTEGKYESLFHFVWPVEMCLLMISDKLDNVGKMTGRACRSSDKDAVKSSRLMSSLLSSCGRILLCIRVYIVNVVDHAFGRLRVWIDEAVDLDALMEAHNRYLDELSASLFLGSDTEDVYGLIMSILQISHDLSRQCSSVIADAESSPTSVDSRVVNALTTQLRVTQAKLQKIVLDLHSRVTALSKIRHNSAFNILFGILE
ncbi:hypothetical protein Q1695_014443 [Nippostrongylus brasiliensis]|nr:hypothetical protein Q1695_014443 [Nippostrongylus brasiliensis]